MTESSAALRLGISSCLLGHEVRFDGGHKRNRFVTDQLGPYVEWVPVCPELEAGLGVPRPAMRLVGDGEEIRLIETASGKDHTRRMSRTVTRRARALSRLALDGYVLKKDSPSCGMTRVRVYGEAMPRRDGKGLFAAALEAACPILPVEEEGRLQDPRLRENFIERIFAHRRLRALFSGRPSRGRIVAFHTAHKLQVMAHATTAYRDLGRLVAEVAELPRPEFRQRYESGFMSALRTLATPGRNTNVLQHAAGHLKDGIDPASRTELAALIHDYREGLIPLVVPVTLLAHHARRQGAAYLLGQTYLEPHPRELMLRNHV